MPRARYDKHGNILLEPTAAAAKPTADLPIESKTENQSRVARTREKRAWNIIESPDAPAIHKHPKKSEWSVTGVNDPPHQAAKNPVKTPVPTQSEPGTFQRTLLNASSALSGALKESAAQVQETRKEFHQSSSEILEALTTLPTRTKGAFTRAWRMANTPVTLPGKRKGSRKPRTKLTLFIVDTIRFGGTFALIFSVLFVGANFQSFWQITKAQLAIGADIPTVQALQEMTQDTLPDGTESTAIRSTDAVSLIRYLPAVGPSDDRLIIPKIGKNVPIVRPGMDALMKEDWKQFEKDIQTALKHGVVYYPGSAHPGQAGNFFVTGHSSFYWWDDGEYKDVFARLPELTTGDTYMVYYGGDRHTYRVIERKEVKPSDVSVLDQPTNRRLATLMTCTPVGTTLRRLIVIAEEIDPSTGIALNVGEKPSESQRDIIARMESLPI